MYRFFIVLTLIAVSSIMVCSAASLDDPPELISGYISIIDQQGKVILQTGLAVHAGDEFIDEDNRVYEIMTVEGNLAKSRYTRDETVISLEMLVTPVQAPADPAAPLVAIYHTHNDEAYIPTDGTATKRGDGSIMQVGAAFASRLTENGLRVDHSKALHDPHDANAYQRSRRTFAELLKSQPAALFDIHRDSVPANMYRATINGQDVTKILLVVGRQNQNRKTTMDYAKSIKAAADGKYRGLIRGIFIAHGNYNQDLSPRAILAEIGTQYNSLDQAQRSAALFADIVPLILASSGAGGGTASAASPGTAVTNFFPSQDNSWQDILIMLGAIVLGSAAFLLLSTGSWQEAKDKFREFRETEFGDFIRLRKKRR